MPRQNSQIRSRLEARTNSRQRQCRGRRGRRNVRRAGPTCQGDRHQLSRLSVIANRIHHLLSRRLVSGICVQFDIDSLSHNRNDRHPRSPKISLRDRDGDASRKVLASGDRNRFGTLRPKVRRCRGEASGAAQGGKRHRLIGANPEPERPRAATKLIERCGKYQDRQVGRRVVLNQSGVIDDVVRVLDRVVGKDQLVEGGINNRWIRCREPRESLSRMQVIIVEVDIDSIAELRPHV